MKNHGNARSLKTPTLARIIFLAVAAGMIGACFVVIRNRHIKKGDLIREAEVAIADLNLEIEMWESRIDGLKDRADLARRLRWTGSDLEEINPSRILTVYPEEELQALPKVAAR